MWLRKGELGPVCVREQYTDTIKRLLADGWVEVADPRTATEAQPAPAPAPEPTQPQPQPAPAPTPKHQQPRQQKGRR